MSKPIVGYKKCEVCNEEMHIYKYYEGKRFCSSKCRASKLPMPFNPYPKGSTPWNKGIKWDKLSQARQGSGNPMWKGDDVSYSQLHKWVNSKKLRPKRCEKCGEERKLHLSNLSYEYKRDLDDWAYLCVPCHSARDRSSGNWGKATRVFGL